MSRQYDLLDTQLAKFAGLTKRDIHDSRPFWKLRTVKKGAFFNAGKNVSKDLGLIITGIFRVFYRDPAIGEEKNIFFFSENQFLIWFRTFIDDKESHYFIQALEDSEVVYISHHDLNNLYETHRNWSRFGRLLAELFFTYSQTRAETFLFSTPEERYLKLLKDHSDIVSRIPVYHFASYLGITNPSLSRIRRRIKG